MTPVAITAASAVSAFGLTWQGLGRAARGTGPFEVPPLPPDRDVDARARKLMSRGARLACVAAHGLSAALDKNAGFYLGVGASGGAIDELEAMLAASFDEQRFELARFGTAGLAACNPLFAFQLMNNFTLCHAAIREGVTGPNAAFFSRGAGTVLALSEACHAVTSGDCDVAIAGGADSALHPVTLAELKRDESDAIVPGEGAGLVALSRPGFAPALALVEECRLFPAWRGFDAAHRPLDVAVVSAVPRQRGRLALACPVVELHAVTGETLAASAGLALCAAIDLLQAGSARRAGVFVAGPDGDLGAIFLVAS